MLHIGKLITTNIQKMKMQYMKRNILVQFMSSKQVNGNV